MTKLEDKKSVTVYNDVKRFFKRMYNSDYKVISGGDELMKILITEIMWKEGIQELQSHGFKVYYDQNLWNKREELLERAAEYDAIIVRNQTRVDQELLDRGTKLKVIGRLGVGLDNISLQEAKEKGVKVIFARHANATSVAEYVMTALLSTKRPLHLANLDIRNGNWDRAKFTGGELYGRTLGLVGLGEISRRVASRASAFGMQVIGYDPFVTDYDYVVSEIRVGLKTDLKDLLKASDYISLHVPLTNDTRHLISKVELQLMKPGSYIINSSRGGIIDEEALLEAVQAGEIAGAFLDVLEQEPIAPDNQLLGCENITLTPHIAGLTEESQVRTSLLVAQEVAKSLNGGVSLCTV